MSDTKVRGLTHTVKYGAGYDAPWTVFNGTPEEIREDLLEWFGVDAEAVKGLTNSELAINLSQLAQGKGNAASALGATVINIHADVPASTTGGGNPWAGLGDGEIAPGQGNWPADEKKEREFENVHTLIAGAADTSALQRVWAENQPAFKNDEIMAAYKARGKELSK